MSVEDAYARLAGTVEGRVARGERMARHTAMRTGGPAALFVTCDSYPALRLANDVLAQSRVPWVVMGRGCGVLVADAGYEGAVITLGRDFSRFTLDGDWRLHVGAGTSLARVLQETLALDATGLEFAAGVPGTVGGAVSTNLELGQSSIGQIVEEVMTFRPGVGLVRYDGSDLSWYHRMSDIPPREIILEVTLRLAPGDPARIKAGIEDALARRNASQPLRLACCDAIFADPAAPERRSASELIRSIGVTGLASGRARAFDADPNYIVNLGGARSADVTSVMVKILSEVRQRYGIELRSQIKFLGFPS